MSSFYSIRSAPWTNPDAYWQSSDSDSPKSTKSEEVSLEGDTKGVTPPPSASFFNEKLPLRELSLVDLGKENLDGSTSFRKRRPPSLNMKAKQEEFQETDETLKNISEFKKKKKLVPVKKSAKLPPDARIGKENEKPTVQVKVIHPKSYPKTLEGQALLSVHFSQRTVSAQLDSGQSLFPITQHDDVMETLYVHLRTKNWKKGAEPLLLVEMPNGVLTSFDNRRLTVACAIAEDFPDSISVPVEIHHHSEKAPSHVMARAKKITTVAKFALEGLIPGSYGEAIARRVAGSAEMARIDLTAQNHWGFNRLPDVTVGLQGRNRIPADTLKDRAKLLFDLEKRGPKASLKT